MQETRNSGAKSPNPKHLFFSDEEKEVENPGVMYSHRNDLNPQMICKSEISPKSATKSSPVFFVSTQKRSPNLFVYWRTMKHGAVLLNNCNNDGNKSILKNVIKDRLHYAT